MLDFKKYVAASVGTFALATGAAAFFPATASAAPYGNQCGAGYDVVDQHDLKGGTVYLTYNGDQNCVVTVRNDPGAALPMGAGVRLAGEEGNLSLDEGEYTEYAGPVYLPAHGKCIDWGGSITDDKFEDFNVHCGK